MTAAPHYAARIRKMRRHVRTFQLSAAFPAKCYVEDVPWLLERIATARHDALEEIADDPRAVDVLAKRIYRAAMTTDLTWPYLPDESREDYRRHARGGLTELAEFVETETQS
jgi:hypothetical protein